MERRVFNVHSGFDYIERVPGAGSGVSRGSGQGAAAGRSGVCLSLGWG